ncbi:DNA methylase [Candidatus Magnetomorum sp. HK-1]|nr:DNA methylase [Candidatus Magnetomorum sp. HK-1]
MAKELDLSEKRLEHLESVIQKYRQDFYSVGKALKEIQHARHYQKLSFKTFESYVNTRWDMSKSHAYRLIEAISVIDNLSPIGEVLPKNEAQTRPLTRLDPFSQKKVWGKFLKTNKPLSALNIKKFVAAHLGESKKTSRYIEVISEDYKEAVDLMISQIVIAQNDRWKSTSQKTALYWNKVIKEKILWE